MNDDELARKLAALSDQEWSFLIDHLFATKGLASVQSLSEAWLKERGM